MKDSSRVCRLMERLGGKKAKAQQSQSSLERVVGKEVEINCFSSKSILSIQKK